MNSDALPLQSVFKGIKAIDLSGGIAGPFAGVMLAQYGADVIKVEPPHGGGDWSRQLGPNHGGHTAYSVVGCLGKRNVAIDLKSTEGKEILWRLLQGADVLIEGFPPGKIQQMGFDYETVKTREPDIIYYSTSGFGQKGPRANMRAMDPILQAFIGISDENRGAIDNHPHRFELSAIDMFTGLIGFHTLSAALHLRERDGKGRYLEIDLMHGAAMLACTRMIGSYVDGFQARSTNISGVYDTADGQINLTTVRPAEFPLICDALGHAELATDPRFADAESRKTNRPALLELVASLFKTHTTAWHEERLTERGIMCCRVNTYTDFLNDEHVRQSGIISRLKMPGFQREVPLARFPGTPPLESGTQRGYSPLSGEHTRDVLRELGYREGEISDLFTRGVVASAKD